jgi:site-specific DNA-adenine methylase
MATLLKVDVPQCYPVVKSAGGKRQLIKYLDPMIPQKFDRYLEPFLGGGAFIDINLILGMRNTTAGIFTEYTFRRVSIAYIDSFKFQLR